MLNIFGKKKPRNSKEIIDLVTKITERLPSEFDYLKRQVQDGIIKGVTISKGPIPSYLEFALNSDVLGKYENRVGRFFSIEKIAFRERGQSDAVECALFVTNGVLLGLTAPRVESILPDVNSINVENIRVKIMNDDNEDFEALKKLLSDSDLELINPDEVYEVDVNGNKYFHVSDLEDGDFVGVSIKGGIYKITHDPLEAVPQDKSLKEMLS